MKRKNISRLGRERTDARPKRDLLFITKGEFSFPAAMLSRAAQTTGTVG
jgi:hypothetical protein